MNEEIFINVLNSMNYYEPDMQNKIFDNLKFVVTGVFNIYISSNLKLLIADNGGEILERFRSDIDYLVIGKNPNIKYIDKLTEIQNNGNYKPQIITEQKLLKEIPFQNIGL